MNMNVEDQLILEKNIKKGKKKLKKNKRKIEENKYYKRWHEYSKSEAPDSGPHFFAGYVSSQEDFEKLIKKRKNGKI